MTRVFFNNGIEVNVSFSNPIIVTEASSDYVSLLKYKDEKVNIIEEHGHSPEGKKISDFISKRNIISETDPEFFETFIRNK